MAVISGGNYIVGDGGTLETSCIVPSIVLKTSFGTSGESGILTHRGGFNAFIIHALTANSAGTSPTLNIYVQQLMPDGATWCDILSMTQITGNISQMAWFVGAAANKLTTSDKTLAAGSTNAMPLGARQRVALVFGGTNPRMDVTIGMEYIRHP